MLPGEQIVMSSTDDALMLTNFRVKYESTTGQGSVYKSIALPKVCACTVETRKYPLLLLLAAIAVLTVLATPANTAKIASVLVGLVFVGLYYLLRSGQMEVISDSGSSIAIPTKGLSHDQVRQFTEAIAFEVSKNSMIRVSSQKATLDQSK